MDTAFHQAFLRMHLNAGRSATVRGAPALDNAHSTTRTRTRPRLRAPVADAKLPAAHARYLRTLLAAADAPSSGAAFPSLSSSHA